MHDEFYSLTEKMKYIWKGLYDFFLFKKKVKTNHAKTRLKDLSKRFRDFEILPKFSETHVFQGTIRHPFMGIARDNLGGFVY